MKIRIYKEKPLNAEAIQFNGNSNRMEVERFFGREFKTELESETAYVAGMGPPVFSLLVETEDGTAKAFRGDWLAKDNDSHEITKGMDTSIWSIGDTFTVEGNGGTGEFIHTVMDLRHCDEHNETELRSELGWFLAQNATKKGSAKGEGMAQMLREYIKKNPEEAKKTWEEVCSGQDNPEGKTNSGT